MPGVGTAEVKMIELNYRLAGAREGYEREEKKEFRGLESFYHRRKVVLFTKIRRPRQKQI